MPIEFTWDVRPLDAQDEKLVTAYVAVGRSVDDLPYTPAFDDLLKLAGIPPTDVEKHHAFKRLLTLRKQGRLPQVFASST